jgi:hypothetical protein
MRVSYVVAFIAEEKDLNKSGVTRSQGSVQVTKSFTEEKHRRPTPDATTRRLMKLMK